MCRVYGYLPVCPDVVAAALCLLCVCVCVATFYYIFSFGEMHHYRYF